MLSSIGRFVGVNWFSNGNANVRFTFENSYCHSWCHYDAFVTNLINCSNFYYTKSLECRFEVFPFATVFPSVVAANNRFTVDMNFRIELLKFSLVFYAFLAVIILAVMFAFGSLGNSSSDDKRSGKREKDLSSQSEVENFRPWIVAVLRAPDLEFLCGGVLISQQHVLSGLIRWRSSARYF